MSETTSSDIDESEIIKILVASDIHLGHKEKDTIIGEDSFIAFEEVLQHAVVKDVDAILLGGDLFDMANPTSNTLNRCMKLLRTYTLGDKPIALQFLSDQTENFIESLNKTVNYEDPNINVSIPIFSIHGNHDDPSGFGRISSLDLLSTTGLINYFGKVTDVTKINISPIMLQKGPTKLALYGLSYISDKRLARLFGDAKIFMEKPEDGGWFNIMVLHQNRADRGPKNYLPEEVLPGFLDLVIWGHEHDCRIVPEENPKKKFFVSQPGSTVVTSLAEGESIPKHCGLLLIHKGKFKMEPIKLQSVRPFLFDSIDIAEHYNDLELDEGDAAKKIQDFVQMKVEEMIEKSKEKLTGYDKQPKLPLIRLRVQLTDTDQQFNQIRFGQQYCDRVANPIDMIAFKKVVKRKTDVKSLDNDVLKGSFRDDAQAQRAEDVAHEYFKNVDESQQLELLNSMSLGELVYMIVNKEDDDAADTIVKFYEEKALSFLNGNVSSEETLEELSAAFRRKEPENYKEMHRILDTRGGKPAFKAPTTPTSDQHDDESANDSDKPTTIFSTSTRTTRAAAVAAPSTRARGRGARGGKSAASSTRKGKDTAANQSIANAFTHQKTAAAKKGGTRKSQVVFIDDSDSE